MKRILVSIAYGVAAILLTVTLGVGAYAIAGRSVSEPARPVLGDLNDLVPESDSAPAPKVSPSRKASAKPDAGPSVDDKGGENNIDEDNSGSGSSNSGSGSSNSGSGSSNSGSGSGDEPDDD